MVRLKSRQKTDSCGSSVGYFYGVKFFYQIKSGCFQWPKELKEQSKEKTNFIVGKILMGSKTMYVNIVKILCPI